jgi:hypothetical protein
MRFMAGLVLLALALAIAAPAAAAETSVVVLGLRSLEGDDDFANSMTDALRTAAKGTNSWHVLERAVSMSQMTLAHNCDDVDVSCLSEIAKGLEADRVMFGTVRRTAGTRNKFDYEVTVSIFSSSTHTITGTDTQVIDHSDARQKKALVKYAQPIATKLMAADASSGKINLDVNVLNAEVHMDGQMVGQTHDGKLFLENLTPGEHSLEVTALGHQSQTRTVNVTSDQPVSVSVTLERIPEPSQVAEASVEAPLTNEPPAEASGGSLNWLGWTLIGVGAASAIAWGGSMYVIEFNYNHDSTYQNYVNAYGTRTNDACRSAIAGDHAGLSQTQFSDFQSECRTARTFEVLQWVFLGAAVVASGAGVFVLLSQSGEADHAQARLHQPLPEPRLAFDPMLDKHALGLTTTLKF